MHATEAVLEIRVKATRMKCYIPANPTTEPFAWAPQMLRCEGSERGYPPLETAVVPLQPVPLPAVIAQSATELHIDSADAVGGSLCVCM